MSDWDGGDYGHDSGAGSEHDSLAHAEQDHDLNQQHNEFANDSDSLHTADQYGHAAGFENDQNFANGHHVEYDNPVTSVTSVTSQVNPGYRNKRHR
jgi:hypothetical protein